MERNLKKTGLVNLVLLLVVGIAGTVLARYSETLAGQAGIIYLGLGFLVAAVSYFQMRMEEAERLEQLEFEEINKTAASGSLFNTADSEVFPARRAREQFERFFVPGFTVVLFLIQAGATYWLWRWFAKAVPSPLRDATVAMSLFGLFALALFLMGKYSVGLARLEKARLLRAGANYMLMGAYVCFVVTLCVAAVQLGFPRVDLYVARVLAGLLGLLAVESVISLVLEIYRPRVKGKVERVLYDSRLVGLLAEPEGLFTTAAHALDYQFGFKVSETWFYRFLEKALVWLVLLQIAVLVLSTSFVFISPGEQGIKERFGRPVNQGEILEPGLHLKMPWPMDKIYTYRTREIQSFEIGFVPEENEAQEKAVLWTGKHYKEESNWLVASREDRAATTTNAPAGEHGVPADLINVSVPVQYEISNLHDWVYKHANAGELLQQIATRELVRYLAGTELLTIISTGRSQAAEELRQAIETQAAKEELGVKIVYVGLQDIHPPVKVAAEFEKVVAKLQENEAKLQEAKGYALRVTAEARGNATRRVADAQIYSSRVVYGAQAQAAQFTNQLAAFRSAPSVYMRRAYLQALARGTTNSEKFITTITNKDELWQMDMQNKVRSDLLNDLNPAPAKK